jgi:F0F1-type ATP synthase assembly protein I
MTYYVIKTIISALIIVIVSEVAKRSTLIGALIISIPLTSLLAFIWLYLDTRDYQKVIDLSYGTILLTIPSFAFFLILPILLKMKQNFAISIIISIIGTSILYFIFVFLLKKLGISI